LHANIDKKIIYFLLFIYFSMLAMKAIHLFA